MNRIKKKFDELKEKKEKALVGFLTAGDPDFSKSLAIITKMCDAGLDVLELGIPFSDPTADGPVIQRSSARSLANGIHISKILKMTKKLRKTSDIPIILFTYYNPVLAFGIEKFYKEAKKAGADGTLVVDLPLEESNEMTKFWENDNFSLIRLLAPTTPKERMEKILKTAASGFIYLVSKTGVTGSDGIDASEVLKQMKMIRLVSNLPVCVGFGISTSNDVSRIASFADGVVIGSAFERLIENNMNNPELPSIIAEKVKEYKKATIV
ncbi:MAG: tryptophan synthase subunit alpha [Desulfobacula sp.]|uniref:tryptophan synthase subunit alpha n=1 Tax=Desulfobacula sp. TaxID=2593537 RepID=UPI0025BAE83B|nr:tryptophan synthase subunit alpha [Desulfobacula sp.]MCD4718297.1 tryptophan synthase subunit alpha [Desulfobacula sp.]